MTAPTLADERRLVRRALVRAGGRPVVAALALGWALRTLQRRIAALWTPEQRDRMRRRGVLPSGETQTAAARKARSAAALERRMGKAAE